MTRQATANDQTVFKRAPVYSDDTDVRIKRLRWKGRRPVRLGRLSDICPTIVSAEEAPLVSLLIHLNTLAPLTARMTVDVNVPSWCDESNKRFELRDELLCCLIAAAKSPVFSAMDVLSVNPDAGVPSRPGACRRQPCRP